MTGDGSAALGGVEASVGDGAEAGPGAGSGAAGSGDA